MPARESRGRTCAGPADWCRGRLYCQKHDGRGREGGATRKKLRGKKGKKNTVGQKEEKKERGKNGFGKGLPRLHSSKPNQEKRKISWKSLLTGAYSFGVKKIQERPLWEKRRTDGVFRKIAGKERQSYYQQKK